MGSVREADEFKEPGGSLEAGIEAETMEECYLWACSPWLVQPAYLYHSEPPILERYHPQ